LLAGWQTKGQQWQYTDWHVFMFGVRPLYAGVIKPEGRMEWLAESSQEDVYDQENNQTDVVW
jgi:hypothetical protein